MTTGPVDLGTGAGHAGPVDQGLKDQVAAHLARYEDGVLPIVQAGHPVLRAVAAPYTGQLGDLFPALVEAMRRTMHAAPGVGLAAPQIGLGLAVAVVQDPGVADPEDADLRERHPVPFRVLVNPTYEPVGDERRAFFEGCLSVSGWQAVVARPRTVRSRRRTSTAHPSTRSSRDGPRASSSTRRTTCAASCTSTTPRSARSRRTTT